MVQVRGDGRPEDQRAMQGDALQEAQAALAQHLVAPDDEGRLVLKPKLTAGDVLAHDLDVLRVADAQAALVAHADVGDLHRVEAHQLGGDGVDRHLVAAGEDIIGDARLHRARAGAVAGHRAVHDGEHAGVELLLHVHQVDQHFVHVLVRVVAHLAQQAAEGVLDRPGGDGVAVRLDRRQVEHVAPMNIFGT